MSTKMYLDFIKSTIASEGYKVADHANKIALAQGRISTAQYSEAARLIVAAFLG